METDFLSGEAILLRPQTAAARTQAEQDGHQVRAGLEHSGPFQEPERPEAGRRARYQAGPHPPEVAVQAGRRRSAHSLLLPTTHPQAPAHTGRNRPLH